MSEALGLTATQIHNLEGHLLERLRRVIFMWTYFLVCAAVVVGIASPGAYASPVSSGCEGKGSSEVEFRCDYAVMRPDDDSEPKLALVHATIKFGLKDESYMHVALTFRNVGQIAMEEARVVYIEFDDEQGRNYIRRPLPHVDLKKIAPGKTKTFEDVLLAPALRPQRYVIRLWIPSGDPTHKFDRSRNLLLSDVGMPEAQTALNRIGGVAIEP